MNRGDFINIVRADPVNDIKYRTKHSVRNEIDTAGNVNIANASNRN